MPKIHLYILCTFLIFKSNASKHQWSATNTRIIGGENARAGQFNFAASLNVTTSNTNFFCMGSLIDLFFIVTSGHCVYNAILFVVQLGSINLTTEDANRAIATTSEYHIHPDFNPETLENDIGLVRLRDFMWFTDYIGPVYLPIFNLSDHSNVTLIGWGQTSDSDSQLSETLQTVEAVSLPDAECQVVYGSNFKENMVCVAGNYNEGTCIGDMGSPLLDVLSGYYWLSGVASFISGNGCESTDPSGYTRVYPYMDWIRGVLRKVN